MGGKKRALQLLQLEACSVSRALWPPEVRRCVSTGKAAQSRRLLIMNGIYLANIKVKKQRRCTHCNRMVEYVSYVKMVQQAYPACYSPYKQIFYLSIASVLFVAGISLAILIVHHWSLVLLLAVVWLATAYITSRLLASDMHLLRRMFGMLPRLFHSLSLWSTVEIRNVTSFLQRSATLYRSPNPQSRPATQSGQSFTTVPRSFRPAQFPETPMPATPLIRVLETIDLSSSSVEHFLEEEKQTSGEMPVVHEEHQQAEQSFQE
ncbi:MAG TPA: hypothetical protein VGN34_27690 [Ktedonobacteraceae bacterium]